MRCYRCWRARTGLPVPEGLRECLVSAEECLGVRQPRRCGDMASARCGAPGLTSRIVLRGHHCPAYRGQEGCQVTNIAYTGHGVEIEDDVVRLRRRKLEFDAAAVRRARQREPRLQRCRPGRDRSVVCGNRRADTARQAHRKRPHLGTRWVIEDPRALRAHMTGKWPAMPVHESHTDHPVRRGVGGVPADRRLARRTADIARQALSSANYRTWTARAVAPRARSMLLCLSRGRMMF